MTDAATAADEALVRRALGFLKPGPAAEQRDAFEEALRTILRLGYLPVVDEVDAALGLEGRRVLEAGCGDCWYAPFLLARGAVSFRGLDIEFEPTERRIQDRVSTPGYHAEDADFVELPFDIDTFLHAFENVEVHRSDLLDAPWPDGSFDGIYMLTVTEHLTDPRNVLRKAHGLLAPGGRLYFSHNNYYCWNGHHLPPKFVRDYDPDDPEQAAVADWNHVRRLVRNTDPAADHLNRVRVHELMGQVVELFRVTDLRLRESTEETGRDRLTPAIERELAPYLRDELLVEMVYCTGERRDDAGVPSLDPADDQGFEDHLVQIEINWSKHEEGHCYRTRIPTVCNLSGLVLLEDDRVLGPANAPHGEIRRHGAGRYSLWGNYLYFSASDNGDPASNGRRYVLRDLRTL